MNDDGFYGPALPPGFKSNPPASDSTEVNVASSGDRKRRHSSSSYSSRSSSSSRGLDGDGNRKSKSPEKPARTETASSDRLFGPALPSELQSDQSSFIGPVMPPALGDTGSVAETTDDANDDDIGPSPNFNTESKTQSTIDEIESRAKMMKDKLEGKDLLDPSSLVKQREEWMVELPPEMTKNFGVTARKFSTKTTSSVGKDRSAWTDTPADRARKEQELREGKAPKVAAEEEEKVSAADQQYREQVDEYNKMARPKSLLEMHSDKVHHKSHHKKKKKKKSKDDKDKDRKKKKSKKKEKKTEDEKPERRPFDRDKDLTISKMDDSQRKSVINRSQEIGGRFGHGATQFL